MSKSRYRATQRPSARYDHIAQLYDLVTAGALTGVLDDNVARRGDEPDHHSLELNTHPITHACEHGAMASALAAVLLALAPFAGARDDCSFANTLPSDLQYPLNPTVATSTAGCKAACCADQTCDMYQFSTGPPMSCIIGSATNGIIRCVC